MNQAEKLKAQAAKKAVEFVSDGMIIGLGTGSTTKFAVDMLGEKVRKGQLRNIVGIPTSTATAKQAQRWGIVLGDLVDYPHLDLAIDGADEVSPNLDLTKGWGGALVREKLVEMHAERLIIIVDESKLVQKLGARGPLPVEVTPFAWQMQARWLEKTLKCTVKRREDNGEIYITDNQNYILHCYFADGIDNPARVSELLAGRTGVVGHGLFLNMATDVLVAAKDGIRHLRANR